MHSYDYDGDISFYYHGDYSGIHLDINGESTELKWDELVNTLLTNHSKDSNNPVQLKGYPQYSLENVQHVVIELPLGALRGLVAERIRKELILELEEMKTHELLEVGSKRITAWTTISGQT